jgi:hypothetical protein
LIDPWLKALSFWDGDKAVLALSAYAVHPMSYYGRGEVSADFVGLARKRRANDDPAVFQMYVSGCSGNVTAGKYNDGAADNRAVLADRIYTAMVAASKNTKRQPLNAIQFRSEKLRLEPRDGPGFTVADLRKKMESDARPFNQCLAAFGLSWRKRADAGATIDVPAIAFGGGGTLAQAYVYPAGMRETCDLLRRRSHRQAAPGYGGFSRACEQSHSRAGRGQSPA